MMRINEIFYSLQGEGYHTGTPSVFVRFAGCNLRCPFCDTDHENGREMTEEQIAEAVSRYPARHVVITGGEPSLQLNDLLIQLLHDAGKFVAIETNGTHALPNDIDWITLSPKSPFVSTAAARVVLTECDEIKLVFTSEPLPDFPEVQARHRFLQPCDTGNEVRNREIMQQTVQYCLTHPEWRLSLQTHKITGIR